jgi:transposase-like protein
LLLHLEGLTECDIADFLGVSWRTVERWLHHFGFELNKFCSQFKPMSCNILHLDELFLKMLKKFLYVWDSYARDSKWLTIRPSVVRDSESAKTLLRDSPRPSDTDVTDGAFSYIKPVREVHGRKIKHIIAINESKYFNNLIESVQSVIRRFTRPRRGFKRINKAIQHLQRYQNYYNFIKNHSVLGMPPAQKLGYIQYNKGQTKKERILQILKQAMLVWLILTNRLCQKCLLEWQWKGFYSSLE